MSPRTKEQFEEIREKKKSLIKDAALTLFANEGYHSTTISMIAGKAEISKGLIYNYYQGKEELIKEIVSDGLKQITGTIDPNQDGEMTQAELKYMINEIFDMISRHPKFWHLYFSILPQPSVFKIVKDHIKNLYEGLMHLMVDYFDRNGYEDPETEAMFLASVLDGVSINYLYSPRQYPLETIRKKLIDLYFKKEQQ